MSEGRAGESRSPALLSTSVCCRRCHHGWYGHEGDRCKRCGDVVVVTGTMMVINLRPIAKGIA